MNEITARIADSYDEVEATCRFCAIEGAAKEVDTFTPRGEWVCGDCAASRAPRLSEVLRRLHDARDRHVDESVVRTDDGFVRMDATWLQVMDSFKTLATEEDASALDSAIEYIGRRGSKVAVTTGSGSGTANP